MSESNGLDNFDFSRVSKPGKFLKFEAGKPVTVRILTKDPVVSETDFGDDPIARLNFVVWNFTDERAQILSCSFNMGRTFQRIGKDADFGSNLQKCDVKISPEGEKLKRVYDINVLRHSGSEKELTREEINQCAAINLEEDVQNNKGRLSEWEPPEVTRESGYEQAQTQASKLREHVEGVADSNYQDDEAVVTSIDEPIDLSDIPF